LGDLDCAAGLGATGLPISRWNDDHIVHGHAGDSPLRALPLSGNTRLWAFGENSFVKELDQDAMSTNRFIYCIIFLE
ncbi:MAG: hypothetical protein AAF335_04460, partial [Bacteroidota bacterium]